MLDLLTSSPDFSANRIISGAIEGMLKTTPKNELAKIVPGLLERISGETFEELLGQRRLFFQEICKEFPQLKLFIQDKVFMVIEPAGINALIDYLREKESFAFDVSCCESYEEFEVLLNKKRQEDLPIGTSFGVVLNCEHATTHIARHYLACYFALTSEGWKAFELDPTTFGHGALVAKKIQQHLHPISIYTMQRLDYPFCQEVPLDCQGRQTDHFSCSTIALRDLVQLGKYGMEIFDYLDKNGAVRIEGSHLIKVPFSALPPELMLIAQNEKMLDEYRREHDKDRLRSHLTTETNETFRDRMEALSAGRKQ